MQILHWDAINPFTGLPFTYDDPNLKFVNGIGMYLEPGDPGFTPYLSANQPPQKPKRMKHQAYYPTNIAAQILWLENFRNKLAAYLAALGLSAAEVAATIADCRWLIYVLGSWLPAVRNFSPACTDAAKLAQTGDGTGLSALTVFTPPSLPAASGGNPAVVPVLTGALNRVFALVQKIKGATGYLDSIGSDLDIVGSQQGMPPAAGLQPILTLTLQASTMLVGWGWGGNSAFLDMLEIQVDRGDGKGWVLLTYDTTPNYTDTHPFPATPTKWKYRAIYRKGDEQIGVWSDVKEIVVGG